MAAGCIPRRLRGRLPAFVPFIWSRAGRGDSGKSRRTAGLSGLMRNIALKSSPAGVTVKTSRFCGQVNLGTPLRVR